MGVAFSHSGSLDGYPVRTVAKQSSEFHLFVTHVSRLHVILVSSIVSLTHNRITGEEEFSSEELSPLDWPSGMSMGNFLD